MPKQNPDAEAALRKLGQRVRQGHATQHPVSDKSLQTVRDAIREQYEQEQKIAREDAAKQSPTRDKSRQPEEPDADR